MSNKNLRIRKKLDLDYHILYDLIKKQYLALIIYFLLIFIITLLIWKTKTNYFKISLTFKSTIYSNVLNQGIIDQKEFVKLIYNFPKSYAIDNINNQEKKKIKNIEILFFKGEYDKNIKDIYIYVYDTTHRDILVNQFINYLRYNVNAKAQTHKNKNENISSNIGDSIAINTLFISGIEGLALPGRLLIAFIFGIFSSLMIAFMIDTIKFKRN
jgi:hypothetical protein